MRYDNTSPLSIETYAKQLEGKCLREVASGYTIYGGKGKLGQLIETQYFGYDLNSDSEADFIKAGVELKVCPLKRINKRPNSDMLIKRVGLSAKERIVISIINYEKIVDEKWETASFRKKLHILLMFYLHDSNIEVDNQSFELISLWKPNEEDLKIIEQDWKIIKKKVDEGKAHEISEGDTMYLGACTKGATKKSIRVQPNSKTLAMQRAFSLKRNYVDFILEELYLKKKKNVAIKSENKYNFFEVLKNNFQELNGKTLEEIAEKYDILRDRKSKAFLNLFTKELIGKMFNQEFNKIKELDKSGMELKCILLLPNGNPKESMSFEQINYCEIMGEEWLESTIRDKFENKKHLWIVFRANRIYNRQLDLRLDEIVFDKMIYWNMPISDLDIYYYQLWKDTVGKIQEGIYDDFMKTKDNPVGHIRPKAKNAKDLMMTPQGTLERKMCFWLNASYVAEQISKKN